MEQAGQPDIDIIVVSYNTRALTLACLDAIQRETLDHKYRVRIVDNASSDGSADALRRHPIGADVLALNENLGFAGANNVAARTATGKFLLLLNPDTVVLDGAIDRLVAFARANPDAGIWGGRTIFADGSLNPSSCWARMTVWNLFCRASGLTGLLSHTTLFNGEAYGGWARDSVAEVDIVSGCFLLIERSLWETLGGFDPLFFMYGEEADLCLRARRHGARPSITPTATIVHLGGASERTRSAKMIRLLAAKISLIKRHWHPMLQPIGVALMAAWPLTRFVALRLASFGRSSPRRQAANTWQEIWRRRAEWLVGYEGGLAPSGLHIASSTSR